MSRDKNYDKKHLYYMDELDDYKVKSKDPDVRGWDVKDADNRVIGKVDDLLVNKEQERVVYLDVEVDNTIIEANHDPFGRPANDDIKEFVNKEGENHIIIPIGLASLNEDQKFVYTDRVNHQTFAETKRMEKGRNIDRDYEMVVLESYNRNNRFDNDRNEGHNRNTGTRNIDTKREHIVVDQRPEDDRKLEGRNDFDSRTNQGHDLETRPDTSYKEDFRSEENIKWEKDLDKAWRDGNRKEYDSLTEQHFRERGRKENFSDTDSFYNRREFDRSNYQKGRIK